MSFNNKPLLASTPEAVWHERNRRKMLSQQIISTPDVMINRSNRGTAVTVVQRSRGGGSGSTTVQYRLKDASYADFYICRELTASSEWDSETGEGERFVEGDTDIYIAKPYLLRRTEFDTLTITVPTEYLSGVDIVTVDKFYKFTYYSSAFRKVEQLASVGGSVLASEYQTILPRFVPDDDIIYAVEVSDLQIADLDGELITLQADADGRAWARAVSPTSP